MFKFLYFTFSAKWAIVKQTLVHVSIVPIVRSCLYTHTHHLKMFNNMENSQKVRHVAFVLEFYCDLAFS